MNQSDLSPGLIALLGSGETLPSSGKTHEFIARRLPDNPRIVILETPAGFEPNSAAVAVRIKDFLLKRLQNYTPEIQILPARHRGSELSPDNLRVVEPILQADEILLGPGSPTYAVRQLRGSLALQMIAARQRRGGALLLSSAATLAFGTHTVPVYEIYKVGADLYWANGLDFFGAYGLRLSVIPHWNNNDGGEDLDTSRCYLGKERFERLLDMLPPDETVLGIDEHTSLVIDPSDGCCYVLGIGQVAIVRGGKQEHFQNGSRFPLDVMGAWHLPDGGQGIPAAVWDAAAGAAQENIEPAEPRQPPDEVVSLLLQGPRCGLRKTGAQPMNCAGRLRRLAGRRSTHRPAAV